MNVVGVSKHQHTAVDERSLNLLQARLEHGKTAMSVATQTISAIWPDSLPKRLPRARGASVCGAAWNEGY